MKESGVETAKVIKRKKTASLTSYTGLPVTPNITAVHRDWCHPFPTIARTEGVYLWDTEGKKYIDGSGGSSVVVGIGHGVKEVPKAMFDQAQDFSFYPAHMFTNNQFLELCDMIVSMAPGSLRNNSRIWLACTGTDATDDAVRLARQYWCEVKKPSKYIVISRWQGFHGNAISVAGFSGITARRKIFQPLFVDSPHIAPAYCYRCMFDAEYPKCGLACAKMLDTTINQYGAENVAAFIAEPVVGAALGAVPAPDGYFETIRDICDKHDVLLIADEVMTGWGRTGKLFGVNHWKADPDIIAMAKGMSSGYTPISAVMAKNGIWQPLIDNNSPFRAGHTLNANAVSCAGAKAAITYLLKNKLVDNANVNGTYFCERLRELLDSRIVGDVRGRGMMAGFEIVKDKKTKEPFAPALKASSLLQNITFEYGLIIYACAGCVDGLNGDMILMAPPLCITKSEIDEIMDILKKSIGRLEMELQALNG